MRSDKQQQTYFFSVLDKEVYVPVGTSKSHTAIPALYPEDHAH